MEPYESLDKQVLRRLRRWPQQPPGMRPRMTGRDAWLRGRPCSDGASAKYFTGTGPYLKLPGSTKMRTLPDGLWLNFGGTPREPYVDIFAIEACGTLANLLDKRSRFTPTIQSLLAVCPLPWLLGPVIEDEPTARWEATGVFRRAPAQSLVLPVRDIRVLYALKDRHYNGFVRNNMPHPHEYYIPMDYLIAEGCEEDPALQEMLARASATAQFLVNR